MNTTVVFLIALGSFFFGMLFQRTMEALQIIFSMKNRPLFVVENEILLFMFTVYTRLITSLETGYITMRAAGVSEETIKRIKNEDDHDLQTWKKEVMGKFVNSYPRVYKAYLNVNTWEDASEQLMHYKKFKEDVNESNTGNN
jgi:hypothetical protein